MVQNTFEQLADEFVPYLEILNAEKSRLLMQKTEPNAPSAAIQKMLAKKQSDIEPLQEGLNSLVKLKDRFNTKLEILADETVRDMRNTKADPKKAASDDSDPDALKHEVKVLKEKLSITEI